MSLVEHAEVQNDASEHAALTGSQQHATYNQGWVALDRSHTCAHNPPCQCKDRKKFTAADDLEQPVGGDIDQDVENVEDRERDVVLVAGEVQVVDEAIDFGIPDLGSYVRNLAKSNIATRFTYVRAVDECEKPESKYPG
jgi:hypothetical protein